MLLNIFTQPWPWYVSGPLIGLMVPVLLLAGNKSFGVSSSLRHICAVCLPAKIPFFQYNWKKEAWNLFFVTGILVGGFLVSGFLNNPQPLHVNPALAENFSKYGIYDYNGLVPTDIFNWPSLLTARGMIMIGIWWFSCWIWNPLCRWLH